MGVKDTIERVSRYEKIMQEAEEYFLAPEKRFRELGKKIRALKKYYESDEWKEDFAADESGLLPKDLKRGVLSEDGIDTLIGRYEELYTELMRKSEPKTCPLSGKRVDSQNDFRCLEWDCREVSGDKKSYLYGHAFHCMKERYEIERWHKDQEKEARLNERFGRSFKDAKSLDLDEFFEYCYDLDKALTENRQTYQEGMVISPYHAPDERIMFYVFNGDVLEEISVVENPFSFYSLRYEKLKSGNYSISSCVLPENMAEAVNIRLRLKHKMDTKGILHNDNAVYISARNVGKYIETVYGWDWLSFKKLMKKHLELTEIASFGQIIYIKQELDEIIRREGYQP